jgi:outer membrane protein assembly factor BamE (lipoprotein component of BamABCDE complex)
MVDAYKNVLRVGMTRQQVLELFGPPNWDRNNRLVYLLSKRDLGVDLYELVIQLGDDGKVSKFREIQG